jgi:S1-C subfamily serine protease
VTRRRCPRELALPAVRLRDHTRALLLGAVALASLGPARSVAQGPAPPPHGRIGVLVNTAPSPQNDTIGARVEAVTPGSPAAKAGLQAGDVITRFNGSALAGPLGEGMTESTPGLRLVVLARRLAPGDTVAVEYRRQGETRTTELVAEDLPGFRGLERGQFPEPRGFAIMGVPAPGWFCVGDAWCDMELVALNPDLGQYFGTRDGILVVNAPADSSLPLKSGDVLLAIGGRRPVSPSHAMRILRSYAPGETVSIDIMRRQKRMSVVWQVPRSVPPDAPFRRMRRMVSDSAPLPPEN